LKRSLSSLTFLLVCLVSLWGQTGSALFQEGRDAFSDKLFSRAVESFKEFIDQYPSDPRSDQADYMIGVSYFYLKKFGEAVNHFNAYQRQYPTSAYLKRISYWKGLCYYAEKQYAKAAEEFQKQTGFSEEIYFLQKSYQFLGYCYEKMNQPDHAIEAYQNLIDLNPEKNIIAQAMERQGILYLNQENYSKALTLFSSITINYRDVPQSVKEVTFYMGECYYQLGDWKNSIQKFESFLSLYTESENREKAIFRLGSLYALNNNQEAAKEYMTLLNSEYPDSEYEMDARIVLAQSYMESGDMAAARTFLNELLEAEKDPREIQKIQYNLARTWENNAEKALKWYLLSAKGLDPELASESLYQSGRIYDDRGERERTILLYERLFNQYKESPYRQLVGEWMAVYYDRNSQDFVLKNHLDRMLREYPETEQKVLYLYIRGNIAYREGENNNALRFYQTVLNIGEEKRLLNETRYRIGFIYTLRKEFNRAKGYFEDILKNSDKNELYFRALLSSGICSLNIQDTEEAIAIFTRITEEEGVDYWKGDSYFYLGQISMEQGNYYRSAEYFTLASEFSANGRRAESLYQLGWSQMRLARFTAAAASFDSLSSEFPENKLAGDSLYRAGIALSYLEEWEASLTRFMPALEIMENAQIREELLYQIAWSYFMMEDFSSAMEYLTSLQEEFPDSPLPPDGLYRAAEALQEKGKTSSAVYAYKQVYDLFPDNPLAETALIRALSFSENLLDSLVFAREYLSSNPSGDKAYEVAESIAAKIQREDPKDEGVKEIEHILALPLDNSVRAVFLLAQYSRLLEDENTIGKLEELESMEGLQEEEIQRISLYKGIYYYEMENGEQAERLFNNLLDGSFPAISAEAQFYLALMLEREELWQEAADAFLRIRYRYPGQTEWISRSLYKASLAYWQSGDRDSFSRAAEMLHSEFPDSEWNERLRNTETFQKENSSEEIRSDIINPDLLTPSEEVLPELHEE
jgi:TolA-binding protein